MTVPTAGNPAAAESYRIARDFAVCDGDIAYAVNPAAFVVFDYQMCLRFLYCEDDIAFAVNHAAIPDTNNLTVAYG